ncbi:MAG: hypothetical protein J3R72DRAFT_369034 [Linnemannia gamsii]|nr:MAG: hypothetical protein J3R72DRAFT_369034 [Linnemannia gamsii]
MDCSTVLDARSRSILSPLFASTDRSECRQERSDLPLEPVTIPGAILPVLSPTTADPLPVTRGHDDAVLYACQQMHASESDKVKTLFITESLGLTPFVLKDTVGNEQNALTHPDVLKKLSMGPLQFSAILPDCKKRKCAVDSLCQNCSPISVPGLDSLLTMSPYAKVLSIRAFVELTEPMCDLLNEDWEFRPQLRYACAQVLAGLILLNCNSGQVVIVNTIEIYGRTRGVDAHRESFCVRKGMPIPTSLPPSTKTRYTDVWMTISARDGARLVIGTQSCNALVTSSLRLDLPEQGSVGGTTLSFLLVTADASNATKTFLDQQSVDAALVLAANKNAWAVSNRSLLYQLRQVRTKFHDPSTYLLCRASSHFSRSHACQPYSIFNLTNFDQKWICSWSIFKMISKEVLQNRSSATLKLNSVQESLVQCAEHSQIATAFGTILALFPADATSVPILGNQQLNKDLVILANLLSSYIATANKSVVSFIQLNLSTNSD